MGSRTWWFKLFLPGRRNDKDYLANDWMEKNETIEVNFQAKKLMGNQAKTATKKELPEVHLVRGAASLMVCLFHLILGNAELFPSTNYLERTFSFGYLGVEVFFILSGYVICYSLPSNFGYPQLKTFLIKRIARIEPPYLASIILIVALNYLSHVATGLPNTWDIWNLLSHLAYINNFTSSGYLNVVYWTLGIEFQFYILVGLIFPWVLKDRYNVLITGGALVLLACVSVPFKADIILPFLSYFTLGILLLFYKIKQTIKVIHYIPLVVLCLVQIKIFHGWSGCIAACTTLVALHCWRTNNALIRFFSMISYSLYLTHVPVGGKVINLGMRYAHSTLSKYFLVVIALGISIGFAYLFYRFIELPAMNFSKRFRYKTASRWPTITNHPPLGALKAELAELSSQGEK